MSKTQSNILKKDKDGRSNMKSREILPEEERIVPVNGRDFIGILTKDRAVKYHQALQAAEREIEQLKAEIREIMKK